MNVHPPGGWGYQRTHSCSNKTTQTTGVKGGFRIIRLAATLFRTTGLSEAVARPHSCRARSTATIHQHLMSECTQKKRWGRLSVEMMDEVKTGAKWFLSVNIRRKQCPLQAVWHHEAQRVWMEPLNNILILYFESWINTIILSSPLFYPLLLIFIPAGYCQSAIYTG